MSAECGNKGATEIYIDPRNLEIKLKQDPLLKYRIMRDIENQNKSAIINEMKKDSISTGIIEQYKNLNKISGHGFDSIYDLDKINKKKDDNDELLCFGYLRLNGNQYKLLMPTDIMDLIFLWYKYDKWDIKNINISELIINEKQNMIQYKAYRNNNNWTNIFATHVISKLNNKQKWTLKIIRKKGSDKRIFVGIADKMTISKNMRGRFDGFGNRGYGIDLNNGRAYHNGKSHQYINDKDIKKIKTQNQDIIVMALDMRYKKNCTLSYVINDINYDIAFNNIKDNRQYKLAAAFGQSYSVQLI